MECMSLFLLNLFLASVWLMLSEDPGLGSFIAGFIFSFGLLAVFRHIYDYPQKKANLDLGPPSDYVTRVVGFLSFAIWFVWEFLLSNVRVASTVLFVSNAKIQPHIIKMDVSRLTNFEIVFLANCITLTPGTSTIKVSDDHDVLYFHALDADNPDDVLASVEKGMLPKILRFTR